MSERDDNGNCKRANEAMLSILLVSWILIAFITVIALKFQGETRDLQRRVGQLESERR